MPIEYHGAKIPTSLASNSLTCKEGETLMHKMESIRKAGFDGMEIAMPDILAYSEARSGKAITHSDIDTIIETAAAVKEIADAIGLQIIMLQPFEKFEGWSQKRREAAFARAADWLRVMDALGTDTLQVRLLLASPLLSYF